MTDKLPERQLRRLFPDAPESFIKSNAISYHGLGMSSKPKRLDRIEVRETQGDEKVGEKYRLCHCEITYFCQHGQQLDDDNARYGAEKPIADALVNLGFAGDDKEFKTEAAQRMDKDHSDI